MYSKESLPKRVIVLGIATLRPNYEDFAEAESSYVERRIVIWPIPFLAALHKIKAYRLPPALIGWLCLIAIPIISSALLKWWERTH